MTAPKNSPPTNQLLSRFAKYYRANPGWGCMHIVLEDGNIRDGHITACKQQAREDMDWEGNELCLYLMDMSKSQRMKLPARVDAYMKKYPMG